MSARKQSDCLNVMEYLGSHTWERILGSSTRLQHVKVERVLGNECWDIYYYNYRRYVINNVFRNSIYYKNNYLIKFNKRFNKSYSRLCVH